MGKYWYMNIFCKDCILYIYKFYCRDGDEDGSSDEDGSLSKRTFAFNHEKRDSNGSCSLSLQR